MTSNRILLLNAIATAGCAIGMLVTRGILFQFFGARAPALRRDCRRPARLRGGAVMSARQPRVDRGTLLAFTVADGMWVVGSAIVLLVFWNQLAPIARVLVIAVAVVVDMFAMLQFRAAGRVTQEAVRG